MTPQCSPMTFFSHLRWIDGQPLVKTIQPYRQRLFTEALYAFDADGRLRHNRAFQGDRRRTTRAATSALPECIACSVARVLKGAMRLF